MENETADASTKDKVEEVHEIKQITACHVNANVAMVYLLTTKGEVLALKDEISNKPSGQLVKVVHVD
jgi:hypothetical protein